MPDTTDITAKLADVQRRLLDLPDDAFAEKYELLKERDHLRDEAAGYAQMIDSDRTDEDLLRELGGLRGRMKSIEAMRIDLVVQAGSGGASTSEMGNLGGVKINKAIDDAHGLPKIKARIGVIKGTLIDRGVDIPEAG
ncbi:MAG: hypothetical protein BMS9Abin12_0395 [Acidimicrobiia bacterium]|nr:MAG: hypothetical protein BMS9Abin12_0395 [Acidimicrobiia bacterium]